MYNFTNNYRKAFQDGIKNKDFDKAGYYAARGESLSSALASSTSTLFYDCVYLAYLDACRKFAGIGKIPDSDKQGCLQWLAKELVEYFRSPIKKDPDDFKLWHQKTCDSLIAKFANVGYGNATIGMAQKVVNLAFKYLHCCNLGTLNSDYFKYCHMALDDYTLCWYTRVVDTKNKIKEWSTIKDYSIYINIQNNTRDYLLKTFSNHERTSLLVNEFYIWPDEFIVEKLIELRNAIEKYSNCVHPNNEIRDLYNNPIDPNDPASTIDDFLAHF